MARNKSRKSYEDDLIIQNKTNNFLTSSEELQTQIFQQHFLFLNASFLNSKK